MKIIWSVKCKVRVLEFILLVGVSVESLIVRDKFFLHCCFGIVDAKSCVRIRHLGLMIFVMEESQF